MSWASFKSAADPIDYENPDLPICGRVLVGRGTDTHDPVCIRVPGHDGPCMGRRDEDCLARSIARSTIKTTAANKPEGVGRRIVSCEVDCPHWNPESEDCCGGSPAMPAANEPNFERALTTAKDAQALLIDLTYQLPTGPDMAISHLRADADRALRYLIGALAEAAGTDE